MDKILGCGFGLMGLIKMIWACMKGRKEKDVNGIAGLGKRKYEKLIMK